MPGIRRTILRPIVTEKSSAAYQTRGEYAFEVAPGASKGVIKAAVELLWGVHVVGVWTTNRRGKSRKVGQTTGRRPHWKRAIVKLRAGETIDQVFEV